MHPPEIAVFLPFLGGRGANMVLVMLANGFVARGLRVDFVVAEARGELLGSLNANVQLVDLKSPRGVLRSLPALSRYLRCHQPRVLLTAMDYVNVLALLVRAVSGTRVRVVVSSHNSTRHAIRQSGRLRDRLLPLAMRTTYPWADGIVAVSAGVAGVVKGITRLPTHRIRTIYNPAVTADFYSRADEKLHHPWFEPGEPPVILSVGKLAPEKDLPTLIRAFAILCKRNPARLMIIGDGEEEDHLRTLVQKLRINDRVRFEGFQQNPLKYMKRAALFALASKYEGFGLVLAEALACGTPVVATDCPYGPAEILENGEYGALVPVGNSEAMARAMEDALNRTYDREKLRARGNCFSLSNALDEYLDVMALRPSEVDCAVA